MPNSTPQPSSSTSGFFQEPATVLNQYADDIAFQRVADFFLPSAARAEAAGALAAFADLCIHPDTLSYTADAERNRPYLSTHTPLGRPESTLITSEGWRRLSDMHTREGIVAIGFEHSPVRTSLDSPLIRQLRAEEASFRLPASHIPSRPERQVPLPPAYSRLHQFLRYHLFTGSSAVVTCPGAMTDGVAKLLERHILDPATPAASRDAFTAAFFRLTSRTPGFAWTSGQWMTERPGGSDVRKTETWATHEPSQAGQRPPAVDAHGTPLGDWRIDGFKWFSSATDSDAAVLLAKTGPDELSAFFAPTRRLLPGAERPADAAASQAGNTSPILRTRPGTTMNGIRIQRLKPKLGTRAVPTAELDLAGMWAHPVGPPGGGTREISTVLNITRIHNAVTAVGALGRGLGIARAYARVRSAHTALLQDVPAHVRTMAAVHVSYRAHLFLAFFVATLLGLVEHDGYSGLPQDGTGSPPPHQPAFPSCARQRSALLRLLTPVAKILTAKAAIAGLSECCEMLGGVGYLEYPEDASTNVARLLRDAQVLSIWEGTSNVLAEDVVRVLRGRAGPDVTAAFVAWVKRGCEGVDAEFERAVLARLDRFQKLVEVNDTAQLVYRGQELVKLIGWIASSVLLAADSAKPRGNHEWNEDQSTTFDIAARWIQNEDWATGSFSLDTYSPLSDGSFSVADVNAADKRIVFGNVGTTVSARL